MQHSTLIATCLFNSSMVTSLDVGERIVRNVFDENFNGEFSKWNVSLPTKTAKSIIVGVGRAMRINVRTFITDLESMADKADDGLSPGSEEESTLPKSDAKEVQPVGKRSDGRT